MRIEPEKRLIKMDKNPDVLNISKAVTIESGALTLTSGALTATAGDVTVTAGDVDVTGGVTIVEAAADTGAGMELRHNQVVFTLVGGGITETLTAAIPATAYVFGVHGKIKTTVTTTTLATFLLGVTGDTNRFGNFAALTKNTVVTPLEPQAEAVGVGRYYNTATDVLLTGDAGTFTAGVVTIDIYYALLKPTTNYA